MNALVLHCAFVAHSYQGVRLTLDRTEELDWPPSPARLHQALVAAALIGLPAHKQEQLAKSALEALRWLEQKPPEITASAIAEDPNSATRFRLAIPQNNSAKSDLAKNSTLLVTPLRRRAVAISKEPLNVDYVWRLDEAAAQEAAARHLDALADLVAQIRYLGRAEDQVEARIELREHYTANVPGDTRETWRPSGYTSGIPLWVAKPGTTDGLIVNHTRSVPARTRKPPTTRFLNAQSYARDAASGILPTSVALFQLVADTGDPDELPLSSDPEGAGFWRSKIRQTAVDLATNPGRWDDPALAQELITGHPPGQASRTEQPHLALVPLPSISSHGKADGRVRRFALVGYSRQGIEVEADDIYRVLFASMDGEIVEARGTNYRLQVIEGRPEADKVWPQFVRCSRIWHSVTPVAIARSFKVPTRSQDASRELTSNERHLRKLAELTALMRFSLLHVGLPEDLVSTCSVTLTPSPLVPNTRRAELYRPPGESALLTHARLEFTEPVRGPLIVGDRRYQGYGLFFPS